mgnify:CR=1 FL=1
MIETDAAGIAFPGFGEHEGAAHSGFVPLVSWKTHMRLRSNTLFSLGLAAGLACVATILCVWVTRTSRRPLVELAVEPEGAHANA